MRERECTTEEKEMTNGKKEEFMIAHMERKDESERNCLSDATREERKYHSRDARMT